MKPSFDNFILFDGGFGTMLQKYGMTAGQKPDLLNLTDPALIKKIHSEYVAAGADIVTTNTFGANAYKLGNDASVEEVVSAAVRIAKDSGAKSVALDIGPIGTLLEPYGHISFGQAYEMFRSQVIAGAKAGADAVIIETMSDLLEAKAAVLAVKENSSLPVFVTMTYAEDGRTFLGTDPVSATVTLCALGVDAVGVNCSLGPESLGPVIKQILDYATVPVIVQPNAGLPVIENGDTVYRIKPEDFCKNMEEFVDSGVRIVGGCCGTTPEFTAALRKMLSGKTFSPMLPPKYTAFSSARKTVILSDSTAVIGERINPTGKKKMKEALRTENYAYIYDEALAQEKAGADILDVNAGLPEINETAVLSELVKQLQQITPLPLQIDSSDPQAIEASVRIYAGKPIINSVNGKQESLDTILPIAKKYGAAVVGLTLDENGIPETAQERLKVAEKIVAAAEKYGISKENVLIDCLVLTASTNQDIVMQTLRAVTLVKEKLGVKTVLGVSNVSFGLPERELINTTFLAAAFGAGLDMPILNPLSESYMKAVSAFKVLNNEDRSAENFITSLNSGENSPAENAQTVRSAIISGLKGKTGTLTAEMLKTQSATDIINSHFIPALDEVGRKFEKGEFFLPQLMASAEAVKEGFNVIKSTCSTDIKHDKGRIVIATVKGDIHDIGKNIVCMLLENYGYDVIDLGRDTDPQLIVDTVLQQNIRLVGLSALMTTTVRNMTVTIEKLRAAGADCKVIVGGAVLNEEYAKLVGADYYAKDAAETVRIAAEVFGNR